MNEKSERPVSVQEALDEFKRLTMGCGLTSSQRATVDSAFQKVVNDLWDDIVATVRLAIADEVQQHTICGGTVAAEFYLVPDDKLGTKVEARSPAPPYPDGLLRAKPRHKEGYMEGVDHLGPHVD